MTSSSLRPSRQTIRRAARGAGHVYLLTADENSIAELEAAVQALPYCARGRVFIEVPSQAEVSRVDVPSRMTVTWLTRSSRSGAPGTGAACATGDALSRAVTAWAGEMLCEDAGGDEPHVWLGGDYRGVSAIHEYLTQECRVDASKIQAPAHYGL